MNKFIAVLVVSLQFITNIVSIENECTIVPMEQWSGERNRRNTTLQTPVKIAVIQHTVTKTCNTDDSCEKVLKTMRHYLIKELHYIDIGQSFLISDHGKVYEGAGWNRVGAHTLGYNDKSIAITFIGNFNSVLPSPEALRVAQDLLECGTKNNYLSKDYSLVGHRQLVPTISPGDMLQDQIKTWPHWTEKLEL